METTSNHKTTIDKRIKKWKEKLLDLSKRNRLLSYRPLKASSLQVEEDFGSFIRSFVEEDKPLIYSTPNSEPLVDLEDDDDDEEIQKLKMQHKHLRNISKKIHFKKEEFGYHTGYIAYGMLKWLESEESEIVFKSPIILIPVTVEQKDRFSDFVVRYKSDEDIQINPIMIEKLRADYNVMIEIDSLNDLSSSSAINKTISVLGNKIKNKQGWSIEESIWIDTFDFQNMVILNDLKVNSHLIMKNPFSALLASGTEEGIELPSCETEIDLEKEKSVDKIEVLDADSSQEEAIYRARHGESFVIQGPPGTGKSQTITNIIAGALYDGKSILFVSEKQAALDVVYEKLRRANLSVFCLKMHSQKQSKNDIRAQLQASIDLSTDKQHVADSTMNIYDRLDNARLKLNTYNKMVHQPIDPIHKSPYWFIGQLEKNKVTVELQSNIPLLDEKQTNELLDNLKQYIKTFESVSDEYTTSGWNNYRGECTAQGFNDLAKESRDAEELIEKYFDDKQQIGSLIESTELGWADFMKWANELLERLKKHQGYRFLSRNWSEMDVASAKEVKKYLKELKNLHDKHNKIQSEHLRLSNKQKKIRKTLTDEFEPTILQNESELIKLIPTFKNDYNSNLRFFSLDYRHDLKAIYRFVKEGTEKSYDKAVDTLNLLQQDFKLKKEIESTKQLRRDSIAKLNQKYDEAPELDSLLTLIKLYRNADFVKNSIANAPIDEFAETIDYYISLHSYVMDNLMLCGDAFPDLVEFGLKSKLAKRIDIINKTIDQFDNLIQNYPLQFELSQIELCDKIEAWIEQYHKFDWSKKQNFERHVLVKENILQDFDIKDVLAEIEKLHIAKQDIIPAIKRRICMEYLEKAELRNQYITTFSREMHDQIVADFTAYDEGQRRVAAERVRCQLINSIPDFSGFSTTSNSNSQIAFLKREVSKKSRLMPTRKLIARIPTVLPKLKPCIMMSPITVSSYFASNPDISFDLVIFDEASQVKPETAIASVMRAKQLIIAGDSKQMPPSRFFDASLDEDEEWDDENEDGVDDLESVLDEFKVTLPQISLRWHYRSRDESLIEFSNRKFYEKRLYTFPSVYRNNEDLGVKFDYVADGVWQQRSGNIKEAERVAVLVLEHIKNHPEESLGIVAFGKSQANAIEDAVLKIRDMNPQYEDFFNEDKEEPFFIKNLENVQGDERDAIILSVGYAKGPDGVFAMRFGPLASAGGERRLNVAISRSKKRMIVVSSFHAREIRDDGKPNRILIRDFIDFAENGQMELMVGDELENDVVDFDSPFEEEVYNYIVSQGYTAKTQVGVSGYKIDMAIVNPNDNNRYLLAIECDGAYYHSSRTARDRDRLRQSILESMGWRFYRIWSTDWFYNQEHEKKKLLNVIKMAVAGKNQPESHTVLDVETVPDNSEQIISKELAIIRSRFAEYNYSSSWYSSSSGYYDCRSKEGWKQAINIALKTNYSGMSRDDFARYVVKKFLLREKLSAMTKSFCLPIIDELIKSGKIREADDGTLIK